MSRVVRGRPALPLLPGVRRVPAALVDARAEAAALRARAEDEAAAVLAQARAEAATLRTAARAEGEAEGRAEAAAVLAAAAAARDASLEAARAEVARAALVAAERIVGAALALDPALVGGVVAEALARARRARRVVVRVHPEDLPVAESLRARIAARAGAAEGFALAPDPSVGRGGCVVESELGRVDARVATKLEALERALASR